MTLSPELRKHLQDGSVGQMVHHPLVVAYYIPGTEDHLNQLLVSKRRAIADLVKRKKYQDIIWLFERPYRLHGFVQYGPLIEDPEIYNHLARRVWTDTEFPSNNAVTWTMLLNDEDAIDPQLFMDDAGRKAYEALPDIVTIWRGTTEGELAESVRGISWTTDHSVAEWFSVRFADSRGDKPVVMKLTLPKSDIFACVEDRGESEVIVFKNI